MSEGRGAAKMGAALLGFVVLGLSPSFIDWQQSPEKRGQIVMFYSVGAALLYLGLFY